MKTATILRNGEVIANAWHANTYFHRLRGLLGRTLRGDEGLLLTPCNCIHTFGMNYAIDAVYLDSAGYVLRVDKMLPSGRAWKPVRGAKRVLELPAGGAGRRQIRLGDQLEVLL